MVLGVQFRGPLRERKDLPVVRKFRVEGLGFGFAGSTEVEGLGCRVDL